MQDFLNQLKKTVTDGRQHKIFTCVEARSDTDLYLEDDTIMVKKTIFANTYSDKVFHLKNPNTKEISLWAIDGCFVGEGRKLSPQYTKKCDCAFGFKDYLGFVEFKTDAKPDAHPKTMQAKRAEAVQQLADTIDFLQMTLGKFFFANYTTEAFVCTPYTDKATALSDFKIAFSESRGVELFEKSEKDCA